MTDEKKKNRREAIDSMLDGATVDGGEADGAEDGAREEAAPEEREGSFERITRLHDQFGEFSDVEVYSGLGDGEGEGVEEGDLFKEEAIDELFSQLVAGGEGGGEGGVMDPGYWKDIVAQLTGEAARLDDGAAAGRLFAECGRILERRLKDFDGALAQYARALEKDPDCLWALQGRRRLLVGLGRFGEAGGLLERERTLASDPVVAGRIDALGMELRVWGGGDASALGEAEAFKTLDPLDPYYVLLSLAAAAGRGDAAKVAGALAAVAAASGEKLVAASLHGAAAVVCEQAGMHDAAQGHDEEASRAGAGGGYGARLGAWRRAARAGAWSDAGKALDVPLPQGDSVLARGHRLLRAAQLLFSLDGREEAAALLRLVPQGEATAFLRALAACGEEGGERLEAMRRLAGAAVEPPSFAAALRWFLSEETDDPAERIALLSACVEADPSLPLPVVELAELLAGEEDEELHHRLSSILGECDDNPELNWVVPHVGLSFIGRGKRDAGESVLRTYLARSRDEAYFWLLAALYLSDGRAEEFVQAARDGAGLLGDAGVQRGVRRFAADLEEFVLGRGDAADAERRSLLQGDRVDPVLFTTLAFDPEQGRDTALFNRESVTAMLESPAGRDVASAALALIARGVIADPADRMLVLEKVLAARPGHLPAFMALRRELILAGRFEEYSAALAGLAGAADTEGTEVLAGDRMSLMGLSGAGAAAEKELREYLARAQDDPFATVYLATMDAFPALCAEAIERIARQLPPEAAPAWWFDAARAWAGIDGERVAACLGEVKEERLRRIGDALVEADAWLRRDWSGVADGLLARVRGAEEGAAQGPVYARLAYIDGMLKDEVRVGLAEIQSMLRAGALPPFIELRLLYRDLLLGGRRDEALPVVMAMARAAEGTEEQKALSWLAFRYGRGEPGVVDEVCGGFLGAPDRVSGDLPVLMLKEVWAEGRGEAPRLAETIELMSRLVEGEREKGCLLWLLALLLVESDPESAFGFAREALLKVPVNPGCAWLVEKIAFMREDWSNVAMSARLAGGLLRETDHAIEEFLTAADVYRDKIGETGWAIQCYEQVIAIDPKNDRAFEGLRDCFVQLSSWDRLALLVEGRLMFEEKPAGKLRLLAMLAGAYENSGRIDEAVQVAQKIVDGMPEDLEALELLANLGVKAGQWETAAEVLQQEAALATSDEKKADIFLRLGAIHVHQLPNDGKAVYCYEKAAEFGARDPDVLRTLAELYLKTMSWEKGLKCARMLYEAAETEEERMRWLLVSGRFYEEGAQDLRKAEKAYEMARGVAPVSHEPVVSMLRLYRRKGDQQALTFLRNRSVGDLRVFLRERPGDMGLYHTVMRILAEGGNAAGSRLAGTLLGVFESLLPEETLVMQRLGGPLSWRGGPWVAAQGLDEHLLPPSATPALRVLVAKLEETVMKSLPQEHDRYGIQRGNRLQKRAPEDMAILEETAGWFGVKPPVVHLVGVLPGLVQMVADSPPILAVGAPLYARLTDAQKRALFAWACAIVQKRLHPLLCVPEGMLPSLFAAIVQLFEPSYTAPGVAIDDAARLGMALRKNFPKKLHGELLALALECSADRAISLPSLHAELASLADRGALLACGDVREAVALLWQVHAGGREPRPSGAQLREALVETPALARLCEFIVSGELERCLPPATAV